MRATFDLLHSKLKLARTPCEAQETVRLAGYIRVSRVAGRKGERFISPTSQRDRIRALAKANGHRVVSWHTDLDQSGGRIDRPGLEDALAAIEQGDADGIAVAYLSRFARSGLGFHQAILRLERAGGELVIGDLGVDTSTPAGKLVRNVLVAIAEFELDRARDAWHEAKSRAVRRGAFVASTPVGYDRTDDGRLVPNAAAAAIRDVFLGRIAGQTHGQLAAMLNERGVRPRKANQWTPQAIPALLRVRAYLGETRNGTVVNAEAHEPVVSLAEWTAAQAPGVGRAGARYLLTGLARCAGCSHSLRVVQSGARASYSCRRWHGGGQCPVPAYATVALLDEFVEHVVVDAIRGGFLARAHEGADAEVAADRLRAAETERDAYRDLNAASVIGRDAYLEGLEHRQRAVDAAREELARAAARRVPVVGAARLADRWAGLSIDQRRGYLRASMDLVAVGRSHESRDLADRVRIFWRGEGPAGLPGPGRPGVVRALPLDAPVDAGRFGTELP